MILLVGASASGKTEIARGLMARHGIRKAITTTTRSPRVGENDGVDYFFMTQDEFIRRFDEGAFVEKTFYNGNYYGCGKDQVSDDKCIVVDPNGLRNFKALGDKRLITFYLDATKETRAKRMAFRGDRPEDIEKRLINDEASFKDVDATDFVLKTDEKGISELTDEVYRLYKEELSKR